MTMWRKSSKSESGGSCVEIRNDLAAIRDSKHPAVVMPMSRESLTRLTTVAQLGR
jgi:hypothetical protein